MSTPATSVSVNDVDGNPTIEAWLDQFGVRWRLQDVSLGGIDRKASASNQARVVAHDPERVRRYTDALKAGAVFPPLVLWYSPDGKYVVIDGNNRLAAFDAASVTRHPAYVVRDCSTGMRDAMTISANNINGDPPTEVERRANAVVLHAKGFTYDQVSNMVGLSHATVSKVIRAAEGRRRLPAGQAFNSLPDGTVEALNRVKSDDVMVRAARLAVDFKVSGERLSALISDVRKLRSEVKQVEAIEAFRDELQREATIAKQPKTVTRMAVKEAKRSANTLLRLNPQEVSVQANGDSAALKELFMSAAEHALAIADAL